MKKMININMLFRLSHIQRNNFDFDFVNKIVELRLTLDIKH